MVGVASVGLQELLDLVGTVGTDPLDEARGALADELRLTGDGVLAPHLSWLRISNPAVVSSGG